MPIIITSEVEGFRRGGMPHPARPVRYEDGHFTEAQLLALQAEPMLKVKIVKPKPAVKPETVNAPKKRSPKRKKK